MATLCDRLLYLSYDCKGFVIMTVTIFISAPRHKLHLYLPFWPDHKLRGHADWLVVVLQPELLQQLDHDDVDLELREPPADAHARHESERQGSERMRRVVSRAERGECWGSCPPGSW